MVGDLKVSSFSPKLCGDIEVNRDPALSNNENFKKNGTKRKALKPSHLNSQMFTRSKNASSTVRGGGG